MANVVTPYEDRYVHPVGNYLPLSLLFPFSFLLLSPPPGSPSSLLHLIMLASNFNAFYGYNALSCLKVVLVLILFNHSKNVEPNQRGKILKEMEWAALLSLLLILSGRFINSRVISVLSADRGLYSLSSVGYRVVYKVINGWKKRMF